jgi:hypothetical protein
MHAFIIPHAECSASLHIFPVTVDVVGEANLRKRSQSNMSSVQIEAKRTGQFGRQAHALYILSRE